MQVKHFRKDEAAYAAWLVANPHGFVFNHFGTHDGATNVIHIASCNFLHRLKDEGRRTQVEKVCSDDLGLLVSVVDDLRAHAGGWKWCGSCFQNRASSPSNVTKRLPSAQPPAGSAIGTSPAMAALGGSPSTPLVRAEDFTLWRPTNTLESLYMEPRLASWDAKTHPSQLQLGSYLDTVQAAFEQHLRDPETSLYLEVEVVRPPNADLLRHYDLENYLFPIADRLRSPAIVLAKGVKRHLQHSNDHSRVTLGQVEPGARFDNCNFRAASVVGSPGSTSWKEALRRELIEAGVEGAAEGPLAMVIALRSSLPPGRWWNAWKAAGDALGPIVGEPIPGKPFNPSDDRIVRLEMHYTPSLDPRGMTHVGIWWRGLDA